MKIKTIYYNKKVFKKGFDIPNGELHLTTQDDCKGKCNWQGFGVKG